MPAEAGICHQLQQGLQHRQSLPERSSRWSPSRSSRTSLSRQSSLSRLSSLRQGSQQGLQQQRQRSMQGIIRAWTPQQPQAFIMARRQQRPFQQCDIVKTLPSVYVSGGEVPPLFYPMPHFVICAGSLSDFRQA